MQRLRKGKVDVSPEWKLMAWGTKPQYGDIGIWKKMSKKSEAGHIAYYSSDGLWITDKYDKINPNGTTTKERTVQGNFVLYRHIDFIKGTPATNDNTAQSGADGSKS